MTLSLFEDVTPATTTVKGSALFSPCERYRYSLLREWDEEKPRVCFIMLNPSTADAEKNDPTVAKCIRYARCWGYGSLEVLNLFALRSTDPKGLYGVENPEGDPWNLAHLQRALGSGMKVVCAWGKHGHYRDRYTVVRHKTSFGSVPLYCLKQNQDGSPSHPLYLPESLEPIPF